MSRTLLLASAVSALSAVAILSPANAAPVHGLTTSKLVPTQTLITDVRWSRRCVKWNYICRDRWGGGPRYRRCMRNHGCW